MRIADAAPAPALATKARLRWHPATVHSGAQTWKAIRRDWRLYAMLALPVLYIVVFKYWPMYGIQVAFRNFNPVDGVTGSPWVGFDNFERFVGSYSFKQVISNTLILSVYSLAASFPFPILLALGLN
jgi:multiple sugar transport system permease protein/putative aldouronate transport system permease protein